MRVFIDGNTALVQGALKAGCDFFAGYPITPATSILVQMLRELPARGGVALQTEDEIAAIGMCIAASMAGARPLTATSGPGLSLYSESIGLAIMGEVPLVIVDSQRMGPATGGATATGEGDVYFARYGTSGGYPIVAFAPSDVESTYLLTQRAFAVAERLRTPVLLLLSKELSLTRRSVDLLKLPPVEVRPRKAAQAAGFKPYRVETPAEVPAFLPVGAATQVRFTTSIHDEDGLITRDRAKIAAKLEHLKAKIDAAAGSLASFHEDLEAGAPTAVVAYGVTAKAAEEAVGLARSAGRRVSRLTLETLWPCPEEAIRRAVRGARRVVVPELNLGQYALEVERLCPGVELVRLNRVDGELISPEAILEAL